MSDASEVAERLASVRARLAAAAINAGRTERDVCLVGVSKRQSPSKIVAALRAGLRDLGENYVQEAVAKIPTVLESLGADAFRPRWHFIGQLQRNKARDVARWFDCVSCIDREKLAAELDRRAGFEQRVIDILLQVDLSGEAQKGGIAPDEVTALLASSQNWPQLRVIGLMTLPAPEPDPEANRPVFARLRELRDTLRSAPGGEHLCELSMGMSGDFEVAIEEGATIVRVGTAIFGQRSDG
jgi:pyridoxal phosphate enzyme (YggS family)